MALSRNARIALAGAGGLAVLMPLALLPAWQGAPAGKMSRPMAPLQFAAPAPLGPVYERRMFGAAVAEATETPADAPQLAGIVGRLGDDAVALVRSSEGATRALRIGESVDGWQLAALAIDAAFFTRGNQRVRVPLPVE